MPAITTFVAIAAVAASVGGTVVAKKTAAKQAKAAKKQAADALDASLAKKPADTTAADVALASAKSDQDRRRGKGSLAQRNKEASLAGPSASAVGGL